MTAHTEEKQLIADAAVRPVEPGSCCFTHAGSTTTAFARALPGVEGVSVITDSFDVAMVLRAAQPSTETLILGGVLGRVVPETFGGVALGQMASFRADIAFVSPLGISAAEGVS